ncbi:tRNA (adenosine(37)-N6)-threonylcarbamoyltransferase complex dimerization subunit type 1 TsaB [Ramlibacter monticola]|uniref:tRNA (Adenosine(37)-N6)-threonylcarbamoyltransferase complex dimerization subunit type 1 TsaB n=1 Tax=Ramlibacter monticola TaxID=1926872 RepID=A0A936Z7A7_9BURK|nr:tRNA (adenosine(37)-N6)-threonylcarbamoyltransferase complex dimerization subunit type 1 TsaB [Ramlibacter monticola]MBL0394769.1 tRNA (adenosine(37)-N6)-threonylcarbamoyltransferase complex dimerization subunit type 1 TsaB [Ramlibacter monticola]
MKLLAFDTSTETLSLAVGRGGGQPVLERTGPGGAQASASLIPAIEDLLAQAGLALDELDAIVFGCGPGSFTGLRTAAAVAQGLGFGAGVPVLPVETLLAVAEEAHGRTGLARVVAMLDARMGEVYFASYERVGAAWITRSPPALGRPEDAPVPAGWGIAGNVFDLHAARLPGAATHVPALPTAAALLRLAPSLLAAGGPHAPAQALPLYIRDKVAQTTEERAAERARKDQRRIAADSP